jgi:alpha-L-fucosidase 2
LFNRVELNVGESPAMLETTDLRVVQFSADPTKDPQLVTLYFQYGRYLLIACSRPGSQAANLQGIWNDQMDPPWQSKYTLNINIEMIYWAAGPANLIECFEPIFDLISDISQTGQITAQRHYGTVKCFFCSRLMFIKEYLL